MGRSVRESLLVRLYLLGVIQLVLLAGAVLGEGTVLRHEWYARDGEGERGAHADHDGHGDAWRAHLTEEDHREWHRHHGPPLMEPLLTLLLSGLVIVGVGALLTERWIVRPMLLAERQLLADVSHELRTPLSRLHVALDIASEAESGTSPASTAGMVRDLAEVERLLDDILTATRLDIQKGRPDGQIFPVRLEPISPNALAERAAEKFRAHHPTRPLHLDIGQEPPPVRADPALFCRALDNLLENAHKYSPDPARPVRLRTTSSKGSVVFEVADEGIGIAPEDLPRVFTPFFRADRSRSRNTGGFGLGLTIVKRIVDAHDGIIALESRPNGGTVVRMTLPAITTAFRSP